mgnify:CR=1 FL=1
MMKQKKQLILMLAALAVSASAYAAVSIYTDKDTGYSAEASNTDETKLISIEAGSVNELELSGGDGVIKMLSDGNGWIYEGNEDFPVMKDAVNELLTSLYSAKLKPVEENCKDFGKYGLEDPAVYVDVSTEDGDSERIDFGQKAGTGSGYYCRKSGSNTVYLADEDIYAKVSARLLDYISTSSSSKIEDPEAMTIERTDGSIFSMTKPEDPEEYTYTDYYSWFTETDGTYKPLDESSSEKLAATVLNTDWGDKTAYGADQEALDKYGLNKPYIRAEVSGDDESAALIIGNKNEVQGGYYAYIEGSDMIYTISAKYVEMLENASYESLKPKDICRMQWESVTAMEISAEGSTHRVEITKNDDVGASSDDAGTEAEDDSTNTEAETGADGSSETGQYLYTENGKELSGSDMKNFKHIIDVMIPTGTANGAAAGENVLMKIVFHRNTEKFSEMVMTIYSYDEKSVRISFNGEENLLVSSVAADTLSELYNNLFD